VEGFMSWQEWVTLVLFVLGVGLMVWGWYDPRRRD
jgi:hypothetical protein